MDVDMARKKTKRSESETPFLYTILLLTAFFFSGATSLSLEVAWSKELSYLLGVDIYATTTVVTAFMAGLGLGAILIARFYRWARASIKFYGYLQLIIGLCGLISIQLFRATMPLFSTLYNQLNYDSQLFLLIRFLIVFGLILIPVTLMGMTLPVVVGASFGRVKGRYAYLAGLLYGINTVGAVFGTLIAGFLLIPKIGILKTCSITGTTDLLIGILILGFTRKESKIVDVEKEIARSTNERTGRTPEQADLIQRLMEKYYS